MHELYDEKLDGPLRELEVKTDLVDAKTPESVILADVERCGFSEDAVFGIKLALEEAMTNAVRHGNRYDVHKKIKVRYAVTPKRVVIMIADEGPGFLPEHVPDCTQPEFLERPNGRGLMLIRAYMTHVSYNDAGNEVRMMKENDNLPT